LGCRHEAVWWPDSGLDLSATNLSFLRLPGRITESAVTFERIAKERVLQRSPCVGELSVRFGAEYPERGIIPIRRSWHDFAPLQAMYRIANLFA
jgi:hypothetical protein